MCNSQKSIYMEVIIKTLIFFCCYLFCLGTKALTNVVEKWALTFDMEVFKHFLNLLKNITRNSNDNVNTRNKFEFKWQKMAVITAGNNGLFATTVQEDGHVKRWVLVNKDVTQSVFELFSTCKWESVVHLSLHVCFSAAVNLPTYSVGIYNDLSYP